MEAMRTLFAACDAMTNYGAEHGDLALQRIGQQYAAGVLATDLATLQSLHLVFKPRGAFWVLLDVATGDVVGTVSPALTLRTPTIPPLAAVATAAASV